MNIHISHWGILRPTSQAIRHGFLPHLIFRILQQQDLKEQRALKSGQADLNFAVEVADVAYNCVILHLEEMLSHNDILAT
jgi:hypothetical protein